jgi:NADH:ubiquinone oxidoreductase subunit E
MVEVNTGSVHIHEQLVPILSAFPGHKDALITILQRVQEQFGYVPHAAVSEIGRALCLSESEIYGVASFYALFRFEQQGEHTIRVCQGTACHVRGARRILDAMERELGIQCGETTGDFKFSLEKVACFGACAIGPVMVVDKKYYGHMNPAKISPVLKKLGGKQ